MLEEFKYKRRKLNDARRRESIATPNNVALLSSSLCGKTCQDLVFLASSCFLFLMSGGLISLKSAVL